jgi:hypothetical protein
MLPSVLLVLMGAIDCITTVIGVLYFGAVELNPIMAGIMHNIPLFMVIKLSATLCIGGTYILANKLLNQAPNKTTKTFKYSNIIMKTAYVGVVLFMCMVLINNFAVLMGII